MNYIYDILLNFNDIYFEFYDWNKKDVIMHIRKIPAFLIEPNQLKEIKNNEVIFEEEFIEKIKNKTEYFSGRNIKIIEYAFLLTDGIEVIALKIDKKTQYSSLQIDEELDILEDLRLKHYEIKYKIKNKKHNNILKTRTQIEKETILKKQLKYLIEENNLEKIRYLYYECFNEKEQDKHKIIQKLNESLTNKEIFLKLNEFFELNKLTFN